MRIFYASHDSGDPFGLKDSKTWYYNLYLPLVDIGHEVIRFNYDLTSYFKNLNNEVVLSKNRPILEKELLKQIKKVHSDKPITLFFSYFYSNYCSPEIIKEISKMGIVTMNWYCNASYQFDLIKEIAPAYDYCLVPEEFRLEDYKRVDANPIYCQEAANPQIYKPYNLPKKYDVTFVGQKYGNRPEYIQYLLNEGINVRVWGPGWKRRMSLKRALFEKSLDLKRILFGQPPIKGLQHISGEPLVNMELIKMFSMSRINLGFSSCGETYKTREPILQIRLRDFEIPMSGGFYMVEYMPELENFFEIDREIVCYHSKEDLYEKIRFYLSHPVECEKIRRAGYKRAVCDHTWQKRFKDIFNVLGLK
ncbi:MAG: glycosyltransferase [Candidatus Stahlbacteria bacterium]|nr:glycosyltransferase [Candidatus Stahlbacteria bacterium]